RRRRPPHPKAARAIEPRGHRGRGRRVPAIRRGGPHARSVMDAGGTWPQERLPPVQKKESPCKEPILSTMVAKRRGKISHLNGRCSRALETFRDDLRAARERDPAAHSTTELLLYQGLHAVWMHRLAHALYVRG